MCDSNAYEHIGAVRRTESVPGGHLIGGTQSVPVPVPVPQDKNGQPAILHAADTLVLSAAEAGEPGRMTAGCGVEGRTAAASVEVSRG